MLDGALQLDAVDIHIAPGTKAEHVHIPVVITESGYIVTNYHVIRGGKEIFIMTMPDQKGYPAKLVGYDQSNDVSLLKIEAKGMGKIYAMTKTIEQGSDVS